VAPSHFVPATSPFFLFYRSLPERLSFCTFFFCLFRPKRRSPFFHAFFGPLFIVYFCAERLTRSPGLAFLVQLNQQSLVSSISPYLRQAIARSLWFHLLPLFEEAPPLCPLGFFFALSCIPSLLSQVCFFLEAEVDAAFPCPHKEVKRTAVR